MFDLQINIDDFYAAAGRIQGAQRQMPFMLAVSLTNAMKDAREAEKKTMMSVFDRPTRYTLNAMQVVPATKTNLRAELRFKEFGGTPAWKYLGPQVTGGTRRHKGVERALQRAGILQSVEYIVPGRGLALDGNGNISGGFVTRMLSALGASTDRMQNRNPNSKRRRGKLSQATYVVLRGIEGAPDGVYHRAGRRHVPVLIFVRSVSYRKRFPFYETARIVLAEAFLKHMHVAWQRYVVNDFQAGRSRRAA